MKFPILQVIDSKGKKHEFDFSTFTESEKFYKLSHLHTLYPGETCRYNWIQREIEQVDISINERPSWDEYFMLLAKVSALRSSCNSRPGGSVVVKNKRVLATGMTGSVPGTEQCSDKGPNYCYRRSEGVPDSSKYNSCKSIHAEANAILFAARFGISLHGATMYCTLQPCVLCAKQIAGAGIVKVVYELKYESVNSERDKEWSELLNGYGIKAMCLNVDKRYREIASEYVMGMTSRRRLESQ